jgi:CBS-domain-containing membrane protein
MTRSVVSVGPNDSVHDAAQLLLRHRIASAPVVDTDGNLLGLVSEADLMRGRTEPDPRAHMRPTEAPVQAPPDRVAEVMTSPAVTARPDQDIDEAASVLLDHGIKMLPVVSSGRVVGVLARRDVVNASVRDDAEVRHEVMALLEENGAHGVDVAVNGGIVTLSGGVDDSGQSVAELVARTVPGVVRVLTTGDA